MTSDSSTAAEGGSGGGGGGGGNNSYSQRSSLPWAQVVRGGGEPEPVPPRSPSASTSSVMTTESKLEFSDQLPVIEPQTAPAMESNPAGSEGCNIDNESAVKKSAWNKPSVNGVVEGSITPVMGAEAWPALSELTRPLPKSSSFQSESSFKSISDGSVTVSQAPVISQPPQKHVKSNSSHNSNQNHNRHRSMKRGGPGSGYNRMPPPPPPPMPSYPLLNTPYGGFVPALLDSPVREQSPYTPYNGNTFVPTRPVAGMGSHSHPVHEHPFNRKRNNFGPRPRGDGGPFLNSGIRRDHHDRDWRGPRSHGGVIPHHGPPPQPPSIGYMQQAHLGAAPFIAPQPIRPYVAPMGYGMPPPPPPPPPLRQLVYVPQPLISYPSTLSDSIRHQIEYYFSDDNLAKDKYLRSKMDEEGWVPVTLIAGFHRVQNLTIDLQMVFSSIKDSTIVEVQGENVRRRNDWRKWVVNLPPPDTLPTVETSLQNLSLAEAATTEARTTGLSREKENVTPGNESMKLQS